MTELAVGDNSPETIAAFQKALDDLGDRRAQVIQLPFHVPETASWSDVFSALERWVDHHYPVSIFGDERALLHADGSGVDTFNGFGPAAIRAVRLATVLAKGEWPRLR